LKRLWSGLAYLPVEVPDNQVKAITRWANHRYFEHANSAIANASDRQIGSRAIQTFQYGPFGRVLETGLNK